MRPDQRGAASILVVAMAGVLLLVGAAAGVVVAIVVAHRGAQAAADLAALAGATTLADHALDQARDPCAAARAVASANDATLASCVVEGAEVVVQVTVRGPRWLGQDHDLVGSARAGPA
ncbi:MAG: flp pilus-assembly TadE/G-like family protein [Propionibacteriales bacterium]|nr:flp pilus-assembly TadE/G-like family protein [Propionibacteriales bacterium]